MQAIPSDDLILGELIGEFSLDVYKGPDSGQPQSTIDVLLSVQQVATPSSPKPPPSAANFKNRKNYSTLQHWANKPRIGPKSVMQKWQSKSRGQKLSREVISQLEKYFVANVTKPHHQQMEKWAKEMNVDFQKVYTYFQNKWRGKLEYEYLKSKQKEGLDTESRRNRQLQQFEPEIVEDNSFYEEEGIVEHENAEEDF